MTVAATGLPPLGVNVKLMVLACTASLNVAVAGGRDGHTRGSRRPETPLSPSVVFVARSAPRCWIGRRL